MHPKSNHNLNRSFTLIKYYIASSECPTIEIKLERKTAGASGYDLQANCGMPRTIHPGRRFVLRTGVHLAMHPGIEAQVRPRSGLTRDHGIVCAFGSIDSDYRGEIAVTLFNFGSESYSVLPGDRIAQLVFAQVFPRCVELGWPRLYPSDVEPVQVVTLEELGVTDRGSSGHGSTGR